MYTYMATVVRWVDGDTVYLKVDLGFRMTMETDFRLTGIDTPERGQVGYQLAKDFVNEYAPVGTRVAIQTDKDPDKYGRWLAAVSLPGQAGTLNTELLNAGLAVMYYGGKKATP